MPELESATLLSVDDILAALAVFDGKYKRAEVDAAIAHREEIIPRLVEVLEGVLANPEKVAGDETAFGHTYALMLLGHFRESKAHRTIIALASLPSDLPDRLFGDSITEDLPVILLRTCNGSFEAIKDLVQDRGADDYSRGAGVQAIAYGVAEGTLPREEALSFLGGLLKEGWADPSGLFYNQIAACIEDLYPEELMDSIEAAYAQGLIDPAYITPENFKETLARGKEKCLLDLKAALEERSMDDVHKGMSWWACFQEKYEPMPPSFNERNAPKDKDKKRKRKLAKASRKKNRRKKK
jgi:hypothetical protein